MDGKKYDKTLVYATTIIDRFQISSNIQYDVDLINQFVNNQSQELQYSMPAIQDSIRKAELNVQWNNLHGEKVLEWFREHHGYRNILYVQYILYFMSGNHNQFFYSLNLIKQD